MTVALELERAPAYGRAFALWRAACGPDWLAYTHHPFVEGMRDGRLPRAAYLSYLIQDYLYLLHYARAWALAVAKAETLAEMQAAAATVQGLLHNEMSLHVATCAAAGIPQAALLAAEEAPQTLAYTRYVLEAGYSGDILDLYAALAPCVLGYGEIGARLLREAGDTPYADWIASYGGPEYQEMCAAAGALFDAALARRLGPVPQDSPRWPVLTRRFREATRLEAQFWEVGRAPG